MPFTEKMQQFGDTSLEGTMYTVLIFLGRAVNDSMWYLDHTCSLITILHSMKAKGLCIGLFAVAIRFSV